MEIIFFSTWTIAAFTALTQIQNLFKKSLTSISILITGSTKPSRTFFNIIFFPGVIIHELAHFFTAAGLGVQTGNIEIFPEEIDGKTRLGSVEVAKTDVVRSAIIGAAPLIVGVAVIFIILKIQFPFVFTQATPSLVQEFISLPKNWLLFFSLYLIFAVSNTMVLSSSDKKGFVPAGIIFLIILGIIYAIPKPNLDAKIVTDLALRIISSLAVIFSLVAIVNLLFLTPLAVLVKVIERLTRKKIVLKPARE